MTFSPVDLSGWRQEETKTRDKALLARFTFGKSPKQNLISVLSSELSGQGAVPVALALWVGREGRPGMIGQLFQIVALLPSQR